MAIEVGKITGVTAPEDFLRRLDELAATRHRMRGDGIGFCLAVGIPGKSNATIRWCRGGFDMCVLGQRIMPEGPSTTPLTSKNVTLSLLALEAFNPSRS